MTSTLRARALAVLATCFTVWFAAALAVPLVAQARVRHGDQTPRQERVGMPAPKVSAAQTDPATPTTWDTDPAVEVRVNALLDQLTTEEKADLATGQLNNFYGFYNNPIERVGIPAQTMADGPVGVRVANPFIDRRTTRFPSGTSMGATFDRDLIRQVGAAIGNEALHTGHNFQLGPTVDIPRTPLWGRGFEGSGEDPLLTGTLAAQYIQGLQAQNVVATVKHFMAYVQEDNRFQYSTNLDDRTLHEIYGRPFEIAQQEGRPGSFMCSFNRINTVFACENPLQNTLLKGEYGFRGFIMSDYNATPAETARAANNGLDQEQPGDQGPGSANFGERLVAAVNAGEVSMNRLNDMARRILRPMVGLGLFEHQPSTDRAFDATAHAQLARQVAEEGTVLLKNSRGMLPLRNRTRSIAVIGADADNTSAQGGGSARVDFTTTDVSTLQGIRDRAGSRATVTYAQGTDGISEADLLPGPAAIPSSVLRPTGGGPNDRGLSAQFWGNQTFSGDPHLEMTDVGVDTNFGFPTWFSAASPKSGSAAAVGRQASTGDFTLTGDLSARWTGALIAPATGEYRIGLTARGDATLWIDGQVFVQHSGPTSSVGNTITLQAGEPHTIRVDYSAPARGQYQGGQVRLFWEHPEDVMSPMMRDAVADARAADAAVVVVRDYETEGAVRESDRPTLDLPREQDQLIRQVGRVNPNTIVVVMSGTPSKTSTWDDQAAAILQAWYPGQEQGSALAALIFGDANPSGRLPATVPRDESQVPPIEDDDSVDLTEGIMVGYRGFLQRGDTPSYPFGYGLSYSTFRYRRLRVVGEDARPQGDITLTFRIRNASNRAGAEIAQVYVGRLPDRNVTTPPRQLAGYTRVQLAPRERREVSVTIPRRSLSYWDTGAQHWVTPSGRVGVYVGGDVETAQLSTTIDVHP